MTKWKEYKLEEIALKITKGTTPSSIGKAFTVRGINYIKSEAVGYDGNIDTSSFVYIDEDTHEKLKRSQLEENDILFSMAGAYLGKTGIVKSYMLPANTNQALALIRLNQEIVNPFFVLFYLRQNKVIQYINGMSSQSAQPNVNLQEIGSLIINLPDLPTQNAIAEILSSLDDKIELNNKINQELENLVQTLFKQWFIDFEFPNENGDPYKFSGGEMVDSELGEIPKGWEVGNLNQIAELLKKNIKPFENPDTIYHHFSLPEFDSGKIPSMELGEKILSSKYQVLDHSILVSKLNPRIPRIWTIIKPNDNSICSTEFQVMKPLEDNFFPFINSLCSSEGYINSIQSKVTGTSSSHQRVNPKDIINYEMVLPPLLLVKQFYDSVYNSLVLIDDNRNENHELTNLRDTLLPKLISGEFDVAEVMAEKA